MKEKKSCVQVKKRAYMSPVTQIVSAEPISMVCATMTPNPGGSSNSSWGSDEEHDGGSIFFGEESSVAPAKWTVWEEEE